MKFKETSAKCKVYCNGFRSCLGLGNCSFYIQLDVACKIGYPLLDFRGSIRRLLVRILSLGSYLLSHSPATKAGRAIVFDSEEILAENNAEIMLSLSPVSLLEHFLSQCLRAENVNVSTRFKRRTSSVLIIISTFKLCLTVFLAIFTPSLGNIQR